MKRRPFIFALLCTVFLLLSGCGSNTTSESPNENITLSNLKSMEMDITHDEKTLLQDVQEMLNNSYLDHSNPDYSVFFAENTTSRVLEMEVYLCTYQNGDLINWNRLDFDDVEPGQQLHGTFYDSKDYDEVKVLAQYPYNNSWFRTELMPISIKADDSSTVVDIAYAGSLPASISINDTWENFSYSLLDCQVVYSSYGSPDLVLLFQKESGDDNTYDGLDYRILDKDGVVYDSGSIGFYAKVGEKVRISTYVSDLEPGTYYLEFIE